MALTVTLDSPRVQRISRDYGMLTGTIAFDSSYPTGGESLSGVSGYFTTLLAVSFEGEAGYQYAYDKTNNKVLVYLPSGTPTLSAEATHTHAVALDGGASAAEASHTHAVALDTGASAAGASHTHGLTTATTDAEAAHTHAVALDTGASAAGASHNHALSTSTIDAEATHTHAVALDTGASAAGASHNHVFTGTAITTENVDMTHNAAPATPGVAIYLHTKDGVHGWLEFVSPTNADGRVQLNNGGSWLFVFDSDTAATDGVAIYFDEDAATVDSRILAATHLNTDVLVPVSNGNAVRIVYNADPDTPGNQVYVDEDAATAYDRLLFISPTTADGNGSTDDTYHGLSRVAAGTNAAEATHTHASGTLADAASGAGASHTHVLSALALAAEATHTHASGTLADAASGVGSSHTHGMTTGSVDAEATHTHAFGTLADAASAAGSSHTHGAGTLVDAASAAGASHTHTATGEPGDQVADTTDLSAITALQFMAFGLL